MKDILDLIKVGIKKGLPGTDVQYEMASSDRRVKIIAERECQILFPGPL